jgi:hypothetical protein
VKPLFISIFTGEFLLLLLLRFSLTFFAHQFNFDELHFFFRQEFDFHTDKLQQCLRSLDRRVTMTIIAAVCTAFADVDTPLHNLITAATTPMPVSICQLCSDCMYSY